MNRIKKCIIVILAMVIIMISLLGNYVYADSTIKIKMDNVRYDGEGNQVEAYAISNGTNRYLF